MARHADALGMGVVLQDVASVFGRSEGAAVIWTARAGDIVEWRRPLEAPLAIVENCVARAAPRAGAEADALANDPTLVAMLDEEIRLRLFQFCTASGTASRLWLQVVISGQI